MKIEINQLQNLDQVVKELGRLGYKEVDFDGGNFTHLVTTSYGNYWFVNGITGLLRRVKTVSLVELRSMNIETLKEM